MKSKVMFGLAAALFGAGIACIQIGVAELIGEKADESWARVTVDKKTPNADAEA
jgi:hypothetical protein